MANQRAADQVFVGIWISHSLAEKIESARGGQPRSQWIRDAVAEYLGVPVSPEEKNAPNRVKKKFNSKLKIAAVANYFGEAKPVSSLQKKSAKNSEAKSNPVPSVQPPA